MVAEAYCGTPSTYTTEFVVFLIVKYPGVRGVSSTLYNSLLGNPIEPRVVLTFVLLVERLLIKKARDVVIGGEPSLANPHAMLAVETILSADNMIGETTCAEPIDSVEPYLLRVSPRPPTEPISIEAFM